MVSECDFQICQVPQEFKLGHHRIKVGRILCRAGRPVWRERSPSPVFGNLRAGAREVGNYRIQEGDFRHWPGAEDEPEAALPTSTFLPRVS